MRCRMCGFETGNETELCEECAGKASQAKDMSRRKFLGWGAVTVGGLIGVGYLGSALRMLYPTNVGNGSSAPLQNIGPVAAFPVGHYILKTYTGEGFEDGVWVMNQGSNQFIALDFHCTHLQCPVQWFQSLEKFLCPCHGSQYNKLGQHIAGPAPRGLFHHAVAVKNGQVMLGGQTS